MSNLKSSLSTYIERNQIAGLIILKSISSTRGILTFLSSFFVVVIALQWTFEYEQFGYIFIENNAKLSVLSRLDVLISAVVDLFRYFDDLTPVSIILIALFQASMISIWRFQNTFKSSKKIPNSALMVGIIGVGCVACGSSFLPLLFSSIGSVIASNHVTIIGDSLLLLAVVLAYISLLKFSFRVSKVYAIHG